jgi:hypothetical protein
MTIVISSTTGAAQDLNQAAEMYGDELVQPAGETADDKRSADEPGHESISRTENVAAFDSGKSLAETEADTEAVQADLDEQREVRKQEYLDGPQMGKTRAKLLRRLSRAHDQNEQLLARLAKYESGPQPPAAQQNGDGQPARTQPAEPQPQQRQLEEEYRQEMAALEASVAWPHKLEAAKARYENFDATVKSADGHEIPIWAMHALHDARNGPEIMYWLAKNVNYMDKIRELDAAGQAQEAFALLQWISNGLQFGELHNRPQGERSRPKTAAPAPISPVGGGSVRGAGDPGKMDYAQYRQWYQNKFGRR